MNLKVKDKGQNGCRNIIRAKWDNLTSLDLSNKTIYIDYNSIGAAGCLLLVKGAWKNLATLNLSNYITTKGAILQEQQAVNISSKEIG